MNEIKYLHNNQIDTEKWDNCIAKAVNGRFYAFSWYLDILHPDWYGLILGDYEYIMPLTPSQKVGFKFILQPVFAQQHGVFPPPTPSVMNQFLNELKKRAAYIKIALNSMNLSGNNEFETENKDNYILNLNKPYLELIDNYSKHNKRYIRKAHEQISIVNDVSMQEYIALKQNEGGKHIKKAMIKKLRLIILNTQRRNMVEIYGAYNEKNELCAAALFVKDSKRLTYLNGVSTPTGHQHRAMFAIIDKFIQTNQMKKRILDFEGSSIPGVARFFKGFGAQPEQYKVLKKNNLPFFIKQLVK